MPPLKKRILVVDDEPEVIRLLTVQLRGAGYEIESASSGNQALAKFEEYHPDLVVLDINMPPPDGYEVCSRIRQTSGIPIVMLSANSGEAIKVKLLDAGADDYVTKPFGNAELLARVGAALRRTRWGNATPTRADVTAGRMTVSFSKRQVLMDGKPVDLTPTEFRLVEELAVNADKVMTYAALLQSVWGPDFRDERQYLHVLMGRLRAKIERDPEHPEYLQTAPRVGYRLVITR